MRKLSALSNKTRLVKVNNDTSNTSLHCNE